MRVRILTVVEWQDAGETLRFVSGDIVVVPEAIGRRWVADGVAAATDPSEARETAAVSVPETKMRRRGVR